MFKSLRSFSKMWAKWSRNSTAVDFNTLAASAAAQDAMFQTELDSTFLVLSLAHVYTTLTGGLVEQEFAPVLINIKDSSANENWFKESVHLFTVSGRVSSSATAGPGVPRELDVPRVVKAGSVVTVTAQNLEGTARRLFLSFRGAKIY